MTRISLFVPADLLAGLAELNARHGTPVAESIRRAVRAYLSQQHALPVSFNPDDATDESRPKQRRRRRRR